MPAAGLGPRKDEAFKEPGRGRADPLAPGREEGAAVVEADEFQAAGHLAGEDADGRRPVGEPGIHLRFGRQARLVRLPRPDGGAFLVPPRGQDRETRREIPSGKFRPGRVHPSGRPPKRI